MDLLTGFLQPMPSDAPASLRMAGWFWRAQVILVPLLALFLSAALQGAGAEVQGTAKDLVHETLLVVCTLGMIVLVAGVVWLVGALLSALGFAFVFLGILGGMALNATFSAATRRSRSAVNVATLVLVLVGTPAAVCAFRGGLAPWHGIHPGPVAFVFVLFTCVQVVLMSMPSSREWLSPIPMARLAEDASPPGNSARVSARS